VGYRVVIPTAGIGSRLQKLTQNLNKSLVSLANRPILSHIIEQFPKTCEFIIALGHKGELVKEFLELAYPERIFYFVKVEPYEGKGSGLGYSLLCCEKYLQQPFVFTSCDTLVKESIPHPKYNWMGFSSLKDLSLYRTLEVKGHDVIQIHEKGKIKSEVEKVYIGLAGINDYKIFWDSMKDGKETAFEQGEAYGLKRILKQKPIKSKAFTWFDTGTQQALTLTRKSYLEINSPNILEKENESIWLIGQRVIKFSTDSQFIQNRYLRAGKLKGFVPKVLDLKKHMYSYTKVKGHILSDVITLTLFKLLLEYCDLFWKKAELKFEDRDKFQKKCKHFYYNKTLQRIELFYKNFGKQDGTESINGQEMPSLSNLLNKIDWYDLSNGCPGRFHGDFHFENILWEPIKKQFVFLDWRQDFAGNLEIGDIYYDLSKLLHGLVVSHELIVKNHFSIEWNDNAIIFDLKRKPILKECEEQFYQWCSDRGFSSSKIRILTALIYLNIAALHHFPYSFLLYALGKSILKKELIE
jgi:NDP-sugar pyrophosphorylase family protein/thiamine kinase-like enzyme